MKLIDIFEVVSNTELNEGRGESIVIARFTTQSQAELYGRDKGVMGSNADIRPGKALLLDNGKFLAVCGEITVSKDLHDFKRQKALAKLTPRDREVLGL